MIVKERIINVVMCGVSHGFVDSTRPQVATVATSQRIGRDGKIRAVAELCGVSDMLVGDIRGQVQDSCTSRTGQDGKTYPAHRQLAITMPGNGPDKRPLLTPAVYLPLTHTKTPPGRR